MDQNGAGPLPPLPNDHSLKLLIRWKEDNEVTPLASPKMEEWLEEKGKRSKGEVFLKTVLLVGQGIQIWIFWTAFVSKKTIFSLSCDNLSLRTMEKIWHHYWKSRVMMSVHL